MGHRGTGEIQGTDPGLHIFSPEGWSVEGVVPDIDFYPSILIEVRIQSPSFEALRFDIDRAGQIRASVGRQNSKEA